ncbi:MAG: hypothetical protein GY822_07755 [Deltaproteobacteria bacterium]|nr:hypothetical protein [Deltaproteobacteria bacterium]
MSGEKITTTTTETVDVEKSTALKGKRLTSLSIRGDEQLSSTEESVLRMHHGISIAADATLATNGISDDLMNQLRDMEIKAFEATGRIDDLDDVPGDGNSTTARIVDKLAGKS